MQRVVSKEVPHPELPATAAPGELPCEPDWPQYQADLPSGPPKHGHGPPAAKTGRRGHAGGAGAADMAQLVQLRVVRLSIDQSIYIVQYGSYLYLVNAVLVVFETVF